ncbi:MAG TPA: hypothetical protein VFC43_05765 [Methanoregula sp.]|nr:hypothetical protein [Methanoregula sp.]
MQQVSPGDIRLVIRRERNADPFAVNDKGQGYPGDHNCSPY